MTLYSCLGLIPNLLASFVDELPRLGTGIVMSILYVEPNLFDDFSAVAYLQRACFIPTCSGLASASGKVELVASVFSYRSTAIRLRRFLTLSMWRKVA